MSATPRPVDTEQGSDPIEVAALHVPRTDDTIHVGVAGQSSDPYITLGHVGADLVELDMNTAISVVSALTHALQHAHTTQTTTDNRLSEYPRSVS